MVKKCSWVYLCQLSEMTLSNFYATAPGKQPSPTFYTSISNNYR